MVVKDGLLSSCGKSAEVTVERHGARGLIRLSEEEWCLDHGDLPC